VHFLGLWDTVSSVGWAWAPQHFQFTQNNPSVDIVRHAVALDERRAYFVQNLWGNQPPTDIEQVWFPGVHCDIGGGYPENESGLSATVLPQRDVPGANYVAPSAGGPLHESLTGLWWLAEFIPKRYKDPAANFATRWMIHAGRHRHLNDGAKIHQSVFDRRRMVPTYQPTNLPFQYQQVP
jgi:hypothetical protein